MDDASQPDWDLDALLSRFREAGDPRALAALFDAAAPGLFRTALHLAPDAASAEDALQEAFLALIEAARRGDRIDTVGGWLAGTLRHKVLRGRRSEARAPDPLRLDPRILETDPPTEAARAEEIARVRAAIEDLPEPYREVAILRWRYGVEPAAIAHARGVPPGTVRSLLSRAADRLRVSLGALAAVAFDVRAPRGLDAVRADLLRAAASAVPASAAAGAAAAVLGGALVAKKTVAAVVVIALVLVGGRLVVLGMGDGDDGAGDRGHPSKPGAIAAKADPRDAASRADADATRGAEPAPDPPASRAAFPPAEQGGSLVVRATWKEDGLPAAGVGISVHAWDGPDPYLHVFEATTGPDGVAEFRGVPPGGAGVYGQPGGGGVAQIEAGGRTEIPLRIPEGCSAEGAVVDARGAPVPHAALFLSDRAAGAAGPDGRFRIRSVEKGGRLSARAPGFAPSPSYSIVTSERDLLVVLPRPGGAAAGRVLDADRVPLANARVRIQCAHDGVPVVLADSTVTASAGTFETRTDEAGRFLFEGIDPGRQLIQARAAVRATGSIALTVEAGRTTEIEILLSPGAVVAGTIRDGNGAPVRGAEVLAGRQGDFGACLAHSDADGRYRLEGLAPGDVSLTASAEGRGKDAVRLAISAVGEFRWDPALVEGAVISGRVVDEDGRPRPGWSVQAEPTMPSGWQGSALTDADGRFRIVDVLEASAQIRVFARAEGGDWPWCHYPSAIRDGVRAGGPSLEIVVPGRDVPSAVLVGAVRDPAGKPVEGASVKVRSVGTTRTPYNHTQAGSGGFRIGPMPPGDYLVSIEARGFPEVDLGVKRLEPGSELDLGTVVLSGGGTIEVRARRSDGLDIGQWWAWAIPEQGGRAVSIRRAGGAIGVSGILTPGRYRILAQMPTDANGRFSGLAGAEIRVGEKAVVDLVLSPSAVVNLRGTLENGEEPEDRVTFVVREASGTLVTEFTAGPSIGLALPAGGYAAEASTEGGLRAEARFVVPAGGADGPSTAIPLVLR